ncbi:MAG: DUF1287 domain-containing protein [Saprospiraceae bacterium]|nr:DUF1287 domain-containing protein [Saprospiraceae bacterium]
MKILLFFIFLFSTNTCQTTGQKARLTEPVSQHPLSISPLFEPKNFGEKLAEAAFSLTYNRVTYDPAYFKISYPDGDVPADRGVCTDVVIRAYRKLGIDLQRLVHDDMQQNFALYPKIWGLRKTDTNIDHRRVPNLATFFTRFGKVKKLSQNGNDFAPGDVVTWLLDGNLTHIGIVARQKSAEGGRPLIVHNIGSGQVLADCLFSYNITGHFSFDDTYR